jgi:Mg/Co/Ni transporter MgtE
MNPDFVSVPATATAGDALERVRRSDLGAQQMSVVCVLDEDGRLAGAVSLAELLRAGPEQRIGELAGAEAADPAVAAEADLPEVALLMTDYNLVAMPVVDADGRPVGVIAVDDVLELLVPEEWRRRAGAGRS